MKCPHCDHNIDDAHARRELAKLINTPEKRLARLDKRIAGTLHNMGITLRMAANYTEQQWLSGSVYGYTHGPRLGRKSVDRLKELLAENGLSLAHAERAPDAGLSTWIK